MLDINLKGSYYDMGLQYGKGMKKSGFTIPLFPEKRLKLGEICKGHVEIFFPEILEEIRGISDATELNYDALCTMVLTHPMSVPKCSILAVTDGQQTFIGRNYDMFYSFKDFTESYFTDPNGGFKSVGQTDIYIGREDGVNERGLGVAMSGITAYFEPGIAFWIAIRYILDKCKTVQEGIDFLTEIPHHCTISFLLADLTGDMVVIEVSPKHTVIREPINGYIVSTNHFNHPDMQNIKMFEPFDSRIRYKTIMESLGKCTGQLDDDYIKSILSSHDGLVCSHIEEAKLGTLWSLVVNLNTRQIWRADGHPCSTPYQIISRML